MDRSLTYLIACHAQNNNGESVMLVLSRKTEESILIGDNVVVSIIRIHGNRVRVGIDAPESVSISRLELVSGSALTGPANHDWALEEIMDIELT